MATSTLGRLAFVVSVPVFVVACVVDSTTPASGSSGGGSVEGAGPTGTSTGPAGDSSPSDHPILALVDTDQTMSATPGQGVGVFTEYDHGGQWHVWWTCDSSVDTTNPACQFDVKVSVQSGAITNATAQGLEASDTFSASPLEIEAVTTTSTGTDGFVFATAPGAVITLSATMGGQYYGGFLFFVEGGKVNDGFSGTLTDPILLQGSSP